jgi:peptide-methionine (S)-S-oxide reductase
MKTHMALIGMIIAATVVVAIALAQILTPVRAIAKTETHATTKETHMEKATFAAGCFWGPQLTFSKLKGVKNTEVGYIGGTVDNPTYKMVCTNTTGHAEAVQVEYDPAEISYHQLLDAFFKMHDPTQVDRQGPDYGTQYRSAIFTHSPEQAAEAKAYIAGIVAAGKTTKPIATQVVPAGTFWKAEDYHQQYLQKRGLASCHF